MILTWLVIIPLLGGSVALFLGRLNPLWARLACIAALCADLMLLLAIWVRPEMVIESPAAYGETGPWVVEEKWVWVPQSGISFHLALDGLSLLLTTLTAFLGITAVVSSWAEIKNRAGFFHFNLMLALAGVIGTFLAIDMFVFYFFWELMLIPMYLLIALWGHEGRFKASIKFFIFTQAGGLLMLLSILGLYFIHGAQTGVYSFDYTELLGTSLSPAIEFWLMTGFFLAFAVKLPVIPFHTWLPDAHTEAPTAGSVILAGLLLKTGAYGLIRFMVPLFPAASGKAAPVVTAFAVAGIIYGGVLAFAQTDLKRLIAYTSISHMGFVLLGVFIWDETALQGAVMQMICHGVSTGALFILAGALQERIKTRELGRMGGLWSTAPRMGAVTLFFALASLGLPGLGNFTGEFLVLLATFRTDIFTAVLASFGLIVAAVYALWLMQKAFHGPNENNWSVPDLGTREMTVMAVMVAAILWLGFYPKPVFDKFDQTLGNMQASKKITYPEKAMELKLNR